MHAVQRKVDKSGCISFNNQLYEAGLSLIGRDVTVVYDPSDSTQIMIEKEGREPWEAKPLEMGERVGKRPELPKTLQPQPAESSRLLQAAEQKYKERPEIPKPAVSFRKVIEEGERLV